jgi:hypothetical protein
MGYETKAINMSHEIREIIDIEKRIVTNFQTLQKAAIN